MSACTYSLRDSVKTADLIVVGTIDDFVVLPLESVAHPEDLGDHTPVEIKLSVNAYIKGSGPESLLVYQPAAEIHSERARISRILSSHTSCGRVMGLGDQCVLMLARSDSTRYQMTIPDRCTTDESDLAEYTAHIQELIDEQLGSQPTQPTIVSLGDVGTGPGGASGAFPWTVAATAGAGGALLLAGGTLIVRRGR